VTAAAEPGIPGGAGGPARIACSLPAVLARVRPGEAIWFDDGRLGGRVVAASATVLEVVLDHVRPGGDRLKPGKGINLPQTDLGLDALTDDDRFALRTLAPHLDLVGLSFVRLASDVTELDAALAGCGRPDLGRVLKIENATAVRELPRILGAALRSGRTGIMVARGDLAVEVGFERLAGTQEDILALCEAAHIPAIWATQVLERMAKKGLPTRAELTDAAQGIRAECVMLNKGPFIVETLSFLADVLRRMDGGQHKRRPQTGRLTSNGRIG
jgi:pyruvate kinase